MAKSKIALWVLGLLSGSITWALLINTAAFGENAGNFKEQALVFLGMVSIPFLITGAIAGVVYIFKRKASTAMLTWTVLLFLALLALSVGAVRMARVDPPASQGVGALAPAPTLKTTPQPKSKQLSKVLEQLGPLQDGYIAHGRGDYATALRLLLPLAEQGDDGPQWLVARMYQYGQGVPKDTASAAFWYRKAAEQGNADAQIHLADLHHTGDGVLQDYAEAVKWYRKAAEQGSADGQTMLGLSYNEGTGVPQDYGKAVEWLRKAAEQGDPSGQYQLGVMYALGRGTTQDDVQAHMWLNLAASRYLASEAKQRGVAIKGRDTVSSEMTPAQIAEAQRLAREWKPKK